MCILKKNRQHNDQKTKYKWTNNDLQNIIKAYICFICLLDPRNMCHMQGEAQYTLFGQAMHRRQCRIYMK